MAESSDSSSQPQQQIFASGCDGSGSETHVDPVIVLTACANPDRLLKNRASPGEAKSLGCVGRGVVQIMESRPVVNQHSQREIEIGVFQCYLHADL